MNDTGDAGPAGFARFASLESRVELTFEETLVDFGEVKRGEKRHHIFHFQNTGTENVEIDLVSSCDCTTVEWPEAIVIKPGDRNKLDVTFDSTEKEKSETVDIDVILKNTDEDDNPIFYILQYKFELVEE